MPPPAPGDPRPGTLQRRVGWLLLALLALLPSWGTLGAPWIAEDASILAYVHRAGPLDDWLGPQYGLLTAPFWRPVVTTTWWVQEALTGTAVVPLRAGNLFLHLLVVLLLAGLVRRLTGGDLAALVAGALVALFPEQGGTVTWLAGRTDLLVALAVLATLHATVAGRPLLAALLAFLACGTKELAVVLPVAAVLLAWARAPQSGTPRPVLAALRGAWPVVAAVSLGLLARRLALGTWVGGYPLQVSELAAAPGDAFLALAGGVQQLLLGALALAVLGGLAGTLDARLLVAGLLCAVAGLLPLLPLVSDGVLEEQNRRLFLTAELGLALAAAAGLARAPAVVARAQLRPFLVATLVGAVVVCGWRARDAWQDTREWARSAELGESLVATARAAVAARPPSDLPALVPGLPGSSGGAYCLAWGVADRFRAPFPESPRPVWPLRSLFPAAGAASLALALEPDAVGRVFPDLARPLVPALVPTGAGGGLAAGEPVTSILLDERVFLGGEDRSPRLALALSEPRGEEKGILELVVYTELGHLSARAGFFPLDGSTRELGLRAVLAFSGGVATVGQALMQAADVGARNAYLELRVLDRRGELLAAAPWIELRWGAELLARALGR
jgi:hypothetical protein